MSYKKKRLKKNNFNQLKYKLRLVKVALSRTLKNFLRKEGRMRLPQTVIVMEFLRRLNKLIRPNNLKINEWVDEYVDDCKRNGEPINILTQWCISKDLEERYKKQGNQFIPTKKERKLFNQEIPRIIQVFTENGFQINWWITFNRSCLDSGRITSELEREYKVMIQRLVEECNFSDSILLLDWEDEVLSARPEPDQEVLLDIFSFVPSGAFHIELERHSTWVRKEAGLEQTDEELKKDVKYQIACEVNEGNLLMSQNSPINNGRFIMIPLEVPERYDFFAIKTPDLKKGIVAVVSSYPWRLN